MTRNGLGRDFHRLWTASTVAGLGDGVTQVAGALLAAELTRDPVRVAGLMIAQQLPWMLFALPSGVVVDRLDRRRLMVVACLVRAGSLGLLAASAWFGQATLPLLYAIFFVVGCAGLLYENASVAVLPTIVGAARLEQANGRLQAAGLVIRQLAAKPLGGALFALAVWVPTVRAGPAGPADGRSSGHQPAAHRPDGLPRGDGVAGGGR